MSLIRVSIREDTREVDRMFRGLKGAGDKILTRTLNKTIRTSNTTAVRGLAKDLHVKQKFIRKNLRITKASYRRKVASITVISNKRIPIIEMKATWNKKWTGVKYRGKGGKRKTIPGSFIATMHGGRQVFKRKEKSRLPVQVLHGPSIPVVFIQKHIQLAMDKETDKAWSKNLDNQIKFYLSRM